MKRAFLVFALLLSAGQTWGSAFESIDGNSQKDKEIRWVWKYLGRIVQSCSLSPECQDPRVKPVIAQLQTYLRTETEMSNSPWGKRVQFASEAADPSRFQTGDCEIHRLAVTEKSRTANILINTDTMNLSISQWVGILVHESVHHLGYDDDQTRLPDQVGAAVASHFQRNYIETNLTEFNHPEIQFGFFNSPATGFATASWGYTGAFYLDLNFGPSPINPLCEEGEAFKGQSVFSPIWRTSRIQSEQGIVTIRSSAPVQSRCQRGNSPIRTARASLQIRFDLAYGRALDLTTAWWNLPSTPDLATMVADTDDSPPELVNINRTFLIQSIQYNKPSYLAGDAWEATVNLQSLDGFVPSTCQLYLTGSKWSFHQYMSLPATDTFETCRLTQRGQGQWQIQATMYFPADAQSDLFYIPLIRFPSSTEGDRFAVPIRPTVVKLENPSVAAPLRISTWRVTGASPTDRMLGRPVTNSYKVIPDTPFWVEVDVIGAQSIGMEFLELDLYAEVYGEIYIRPYSSRIDHMQPIVLRNERLATSGGTRLRYQMVLPSGTDVPILGFKIRRFYMETSDFSWSEMQLRQITEANFLGERLARSRQEGSFLHGNLIQ
jgi:hypothetical protein